MNKIEKCFGKAVVILFGVLQFNYAVAVLNIDITEGVEHKLPIAVLPFASQMDVKLKDIEADSSLFAKIISNDLNSSGKFLFANKGLLSKYNNLKGEQQISFFQNEGFDYVLQGKVEQLDEERYRVEVALVDIYKTINLEKHLENKKAISLSEAAKTRGYTLFRQTFENIRANQFRALSHHISDAVYKQLIGHKGYFSTKIAYITEERIVTSSWGRGKQYREFSLVVSDYDGENSRVIVKTRAPMMSPSWSPDGKKIAYVSFESGAAQIYSIDLNNGKKSLLSSFKGINGAPKWSPDGKKLALVLSKDGGPNLYLYDLTKGSFKRLTWGNAIDTEPSWSKDSSSLLFTSNRGGRPQIYSLNLATNKIERVTFVGNYNASASYTPDAKSIIMMHRGDKDRHFQLAKYDLHTGTLNTLTRDNYDQSPGIAPNGDAIVFSRKNNNSYELGIISVGGGVNTKLKTKGCAHYVAWSPFLS